MGYHDQPFSNWLARQKNCNNKRKYTSRTMTLSDLVKTESHKDAVVTEVPQPQVTGAAAVEEAMPGIGIKIDSTSGTVSVSVTVKAAADFKLAFEQEIAVGIDCSTSMRYNGGYQGVGHMIELASTPRSCRKTATSSRLGSSFSRRACFCRRPASHVSLSRSHSGAASSPGTCSTHSKATE